MAFIAPIAGAALGGLLTGWAGWGLSVGWLVGSWLFGPKAEYENQVLDTGAEEMPTFNQALRGSTMAILFGTNRVSSHIVWQNDFTTIRHESNKGGGGGKFGGSGMGNKAGGPETTEVTYTYKWDLMFHAGMVGEGYNLFGGWLGPERLNDATLLAIIGGSGGSAGFFTNPEGRPQNAELSFESAFFHAGNATGDANADNWSNFETVEGGTYRWPYTVYIGFKQLNLGSSARVPQLTWEIGPGDISITSEDAVFKFTQDGAGTIQNFNCYGPNGNTFTGEDGEVYTGEAIGGRFDIWKQDGTFVYTIDKDDVYTDMAAAGFTIVGSASDAQYWTCSGVISGTNYIYVAVGTEVSPVKLEVLFALYKVNSAGAAEYQGAFRSSYSGLAWPPAYGSQCYRFGLGTGSDELCLMGNVTVSSYTSIVVWRLPTLNEILANNFDEYTLSGTLPINQRMFVFDGDITAFTGNGLSTTSAMGVTNPGPNIHPRGAILPFITISSLGIPSIASRLYMEYNAGHLAHVRTQPSSYPAISSYASGTYSLGIILEFPMTNPATTGPAAFVVDDVMVVANSRFVDRSGDAVYPRTLSDQYDCASIIAGSSALNNYSTRWSVQELSTGVAAGGTLISFSKGYRNDLVLDPGAIISAGFSDGTWGRVKAGIWNPILGTYTEYFNVVHQCGNYSGDFGKSLISNYQIYTRAQHLDEDYTYKLYQTSFDVYEDKFSMYTIGTVNIGGGTDVSPPYIIYQILTSEVFGIGFTADDIDLTSYGLAVQYCQSEEIEVSVQYRREEGALAIIDELLSLYGGFLTDKGGKIYFGLQQFTQSPVRTINNEHLVIEQDGEAPVRVTKGARQDTYNRVKVNYFDRNLEYRQNFVELSDEVDMDINGVRPQEYPAKFVMSEATALKIATRALWGNLYARDIYDFKLGPKDADLEPGDVITLVDSYNSNLSGGKQVRIVEWQETQPLIFRCKAVDEIEWVNASSTAADSATEVGSNPLFGPAAPPADFQMYELPKEFQGADARLFVGYRQQSATMGARLYVSADGASFTQTDDVQPYIISGILKEGLPNRDVGYVEENIEVYLMPDTRSTAFNPSTPTYCQTFALEDSSANGRALGASALWINSEMIAYEGINLLGQNHYRFDKVYRGWGGTHIQGHSSGDTWWRHAGGVFTQALNVDKVGNLFYYKVQPYNFAGVGYNISSIDAKTYQIQGTYWKPQNPGALRTFVQSPGSYVTIQSEDLNFITKKKVIAGGSPVQIEWPDASRESGYGALGNGYLTYGEFITDTTSHQYRIQVYSSDGSTVVRCTTVSTLAFLYTVDNNSTDFNGWAGNFRVKVTPYNTYGDSLRSRTKILELFE